MLRGAAALSTGCFGCSVSGMLGPAEARTRGARLIAPPIAAVGPEKRAERGNGFRDGVLPYTVPQDMAGLPSCAVPVGVDELGLPVGVQVTGPPWSERRVLAAADALYQRASWKMTPSAVR